MCAAPGSKTAQLIEMMHAGETDSLPGNCDRVLSALAMTKTLRIFSQKTVQLASKL